MKYLHLLFRSNVMLEDDRNMVLDYCLTENYSWSNEVEPLYGIQIMKHLNDVIETEEVVAISSSKKDVETMLNTLFKHKVTPISMLEVVDDLVSEGILV